MSIRSVMYAKWLSVLILCTLWAGAGQAQISFKTLKEFPAFKLTGTNGEVFTTTEVVKKNKPTVIIYLSPTCKHCQKQMEDITGNMKTFKDVQFLVVTAYPPEDTQAFLADYAVERFPNIRFGYDPEFKMGRFFELDGVPGVFIYNKERILHRFFDTNVKPQKLYSAIYE